MVSARLSRADTAGDLQSKIDQNNAAIQSLEKEMQGYQKQIDSLGTQETSLAQTIKSLDLTMLKLNADITVTEDKIEAKDLEIQGLGSRISDNQKATSDDQRYISQAFLTLDQMTDDSFIAMILNSQSISQAFNSAQSIAILQQNLREHVSGLKNDSQTLQASMNDSQKAKTDLVSLQDNLSNQRKIVVATSQEKNSLLKQTNQSESSYRKMLADKQSQTIALQQEIDVYESQLHLNVSASLLPHTGPGVLFWPLANTYPGACPPPSGAYTSCITQYFGNTPFATANPQIYGGIGHDGVDFRATIGTPVQAALTGQVIGMGNTDLYIGCYSFGKWIMIKHANGLSTLYAHLSLQNVNTGDIVSTGQIIGYSGNTGYTTGPHLHFGVYATQGVELKLFSTSKHCQGAVIPIADYSAYLNPLSYL